METENEVGVKKYQLITIRQNICSNISGTIRFVFLKKPNIILNYFDHILIMHNISTLDIINYIWPVSRAPTHIQQVWLSENSCHAAIWTQARDISQLSN